jgi:hypothetical protein
MKPAMPTPVRAAWNPNGLPGTPGTGNVGKPTTQALYTSEVPAVGWNHGVALLSWPNAVGQLEIVSKLGLGTRFTASADRGATRAAAHTSAARAA